MAKQYTTVTHRDISRGIDARSAENRIPDGYSEDLQNVETNSEGHLVKRKGYQGHCGYVPLRVSSLGYTKDSTNNICFTLDSSVDLSTVRSTPLVAFGKLSESKSEGDYTDTDSAHYYPSFTVDKTKTLSAPSGTLTIPATEHGLSVDTLFVGIAESTSATNNSNSQLLVDAVRVDQGTFDVDIDYTVASDTEVYVYVADKSAVGGDVYVHPTTASTSISITAATHNLDNSNIIPKVFEDDSGDWREVTPDTFTVTPAGDVTVTFSSSASYRVILSAAPVTQFSNGTLAAGETRTINILNAGGDFPFVGAYEELTLGGDRELIIPDSIELDDSTDTLSVTLTNSRATSVNFEFYYEFAALALNVLKVTGDTLPTIAAYTEDTPQITLWGISHSGLYPTSAKGGHVHEIDSYRREGEERVVAGLGGVLHSARTFAEVGTTYLLPQRFPNLRGRVATDFDVAPLFQATGSSTARTNGKITADGAGDGFVEVTSATYDAASGYVDYELSLPSKAILDGSGSPTTLGAVIFTAAPTQDWVDIQCMNHSRLNGRFKIITATDGVGDTITLRVDNPDVSSGDWDEADAGGIAGIFTDRVTLLATSQFLPDDRISGDTVPADRLFTVEASDGTTLQLAGVDQPTEMPSGLRVYATRTTDTIQLRTDLNVVSVTNFVAGDMVQVSNLERQLRVKYINPNANIALSLTGDGDTATATLGSGTTAFLSVGQSVIITGSSEYQGAQTVTAILSTTAFQFASASTATTTATLQGNTVQFDESLEIMDDAANTTAYTTACRWIPVEAPSTSSDLVPPTRVRYWDALGPDAQPTTRSTMVNDNMYFVNGQDEVMKFDGTSLYRAGLFRWQPQLFAQVDTTTGSIVPDPTPINYTAVDAGAKKFTVDFTADLVAGDRLQDTDTGEFYTVNRVDADSDAIFIEETPTAATGGTDQLTRVAVYHYYFRLNAVDANNNIVASAVTGADDFLVELGTAGQIKMRLVGMPAWDIYDYDRLEVEVYRTKANDALNYFKIRTVTMPFNAGSGYIDVTDGLSDFALTTEDVVNIGLLGAELGTTWEQPPRAKYLTSAANRMILANLRDYPQLNITMRLQDQDAALTAAELAGNRWLFRRDNTDTATTTSMGTRAAYEWVDTGGAVMLTPAAHLTNNAGASFTVASPGHSLEVGDWVYLYHAAEGTVNNLTYAGWWQIASRTAGVDFTINFTHDDSFAPSAADVDRYVTATLPADIPVLVGTDGNLNMNNGNVASAGDTFEFQAMLRLANAINASMRVTDTSVSGQGSFDPWLVAEAGSEFTAGQIRVRQPKVVATSLEVLLPALTEADLFVNGLRRAASTEVGASTSVGASRILVSFENYPEIFDNPGAVLPSDSRSVIDVNSADGQEITGVIPFYGSATFGAGQNEGVVVVFKTNSVYIVDILSKSVQKLETQGLGCTAPFSISVTDRGIMFVNESGIYRLNRDMSISYVGSRAERLWLSTVNRDQISEVTGHHFAVGRQFKLSVPVNSDATNSQVLVYDHTREGREQEFGAWSRFTNHPATGWTNLRADAYFGTTDGQVFGVRRAGDVTDYRDDGDAVDNMVILYKALDFGTSGRRKVAASIVSHFRSEFPMKSTTLETALDLTTQFTDAGTMALALDETTDGMGDVGQPKVRAIKSSLLGRRFVYLQLRYQNSAKDEPVELAGVDFRIAGLGDELISEAQRLTTAQNSATIGT